MESVTHLEKVVTGEAPAVTHLEKVITEEVAAVTYTEKVIAGEAPPITHLQKVIAGEADPVTHLEYVWAGGSPPTEYEYTGAVPVTFTANGQPLLDYTIYGNTTQNGTPTPDNPVMPQGTGERTGNLFSSNWEQGSINGTTGNNQNSDIVVRTAGYIPITYNVLYSMKRDKASAYMNLRLYDANKNFIGTGTNEYISVIVGTSAANPMGAGYSFCVFKTISEDVAYIRINDVTNDLSTHYMMVEGEYTEQTMPSYQPYGIKIPISSANTTTPVYLGEVETTRKIKKLVLTGEGNWIQAVVALNVYRIIVPDYLREVINIPLCTHYKGIDPVASTGGLQDLETAFLLSSSGNNYYYIRDDRFNNANDFKSYLAQQYAAGTPVTVWYVLATPETAVVNEPLMKIGDYADTLSKAQAGVEIPTVRGTNTLDVLTDVKPSEIHIKYKG